MLDEEGEGGAETIELVAAAGSAIVQAAHLEMLREVRPPRARNRLIAALKRSGAWAPLEMLCATVGARIVRTDRRAGGAPADRCARSSRPQALGEGVPLGIDETENSSVRGWSVYAEVVGATAAESAAASEGGAGLVKLHSLDAALLLTWACGPAAATNARADDSDEEWGHDDCSESDDENQPMDALVMGHCDMGIDDRG